MKFDQLIGGSYTGRASNADAERSVNWYTETIESKTGQTKTERVLAPRPGLAWFASLDLPQMVTAGHTYIDPSLTGADASGPASIGVDIVKVGYTGPAVWNPPGFEGYPPHWWLNLAYNPEEGAESGDPYYWPFTANYLQISPCPYYPSGADAIGTGTASLSVLLPGASSPLTVTVSNAYFSMPLSPPITLNQGDVWKCWVNSASYTLDGSAYQPNFYVELTVQNSWCPITGDD
jgi:hypothetical protein